MVFKAGGNPALATEFAHWLTSAGDRFLPPMRKLVEQPFWLDSSDPDRMRSAMQIVIRTHLPITMGVKDHEW